MMGIFSLFLTFVLTSLIDWGNNQQNNALMADHTYCMQSVAALYSTNATIDEETVISTSLYSLVVNMAALMGSSWLIFLNDYLSSISLRFWVFSCTGNTARWYYSISHLYVKAVVIGDAKFIFCAKYVEKYSTVCHRLMIYDSWSGETHWGHSHRVFMSILQSWFMWLNV